MVKPEKAAYSRLALNEGLKQLKAVHLTAARKNCYYPIYSNLNEIKNWLEDYGGNRHAFYCYHLEEYRNRLYNQYKETTSEFMTFMFTVFVQEVPEAMHELGHHVYNELRKEN